jgi:4-hydroxy-tetrahydrodipicolinate reductase
MKIALIGYGKMGKTIDALALKSGHEVVLRIDESNRKELNKDMIRKADVVIEFTRPDAVVANLMFCLKAGVPVVSGTTGWQDQWTFVKSEFLMERGSLMYATNYSIGVNLLWELNRRLAEWMNRYPEYKPSLHEVHHIHKLDKPSGTAVTMAIDLIDKYHRISSYVLSEANDDVPENSLAVHSVREKDVIGIHEMCWTSEVDRIQIRHEAFNRDGFARGALIAAEWLIGRKGVFGMSDLLFGEQKQQ